MDVVSNRKGDVADTVGMPDEKDYQDLLRIIQRYEKRNPGKIAYTLKQARRDLELGRYSKSILWKGDAVVNKDSNMIWAFELPADLHAKIEKKFPSMFRSKKHLRWFKKNFYKLTISENRKV